MSLAPIFSSCLMFFVPSSQKLSTDGLISSKKWTDWKNVACTPAVSTNVFVNSPVMVRFEFIDLQGQCSLLLNYIDISNKYQTNT